MGLSDDICADDLAVVGNVSIPRAVLLRVVAVNDLLRQPRTQHQRPIEEKGGVIDDVLMICMYTSDEALAVPENPDRVQVPS